MRNTLAKIKPLRELYTKFKIVRQLTIQRKQIKNYLENTKIVKVHLGCGPNIIESWLNFDYAPSNMLVVHFDARKQIPLESSSTDFIFCEHMIEHIPAASGINLLKECHRILKNGGVLRLSTPEITKICGLLTDESNFSREYIEWSTKEFLHTEKSRAEYVVSNFFRDWGHELLYSKKLLVEIIDEIGFKEIKECKVRESDYFDLQNLENDGRMPKGFLEFESLILEIKK